ncbi:hypothetical protein FACS1894181_17310 [Bacteroidia bacterium]|nr:hypothetical protein FACS1894181_17310 [Bacteroidia bacterium]
MKTLFALPFLAIISLQAQTVAFNPPVYVCYKLPAPIAIDGKITEEEWGGVPLMGDFADIHDNGPKPYLQTLVKMAHDDNGLYFAARMEEPHLWATFTEHDAPLYQENAFEFFIDPSNSTHNYLEYEVNALGTEWDLFLNKPYRDAPMLVLSAYEFLGMRSKVYLSGTLNNPSDKDEFWSVEIFVPWHSIYQVADSPRNKPAEGGQMRVNLQRVEWPLEVQGGKYAKAILPGAERPRPNFWLWASQGSTGTSHAPEYWGYVQFTEKTAGSETVPFIMNPGEDIRAKLRNLYYRQKAYFRANKAYAPSLAGLKPEEVFPSGSAQKLKLYNTPSFYEITYTSDDKVWHLSQDGLIW